MILEGVIGIGIAPVIRAAVGYFKPVWEKAGERLQPIFTTVFACLFGTAFAYLMNIYTKGLQTPQDILAIGVLSAFAAVLYNDSRTQIEKQ